MRRGEDVGTATEYFLGFHRRGPQSRPDVSVSIAVGLHAPLTCRVVRRARRRGGWSRSGLRRSMETCSDTPATIDGWSSRLAHGKIHRTASRTQGVLHTGPSTMWRGSELRESSPMTVRVGGAGQRKRCTSRCRIENEQYAERLRGWQRVRGCRVALIYCTRVH